MSMTAGKLTFLFCCYFSICVCAYPHLSMWSFYIEFEADNHKKVYTIRATGTSHIRTVPNYNHVATTYGCVTDKLFPSTLDVFFLAPSAMADLGARDLLVRVTRS